MILKDTEGFGRTMGLLLEQEEITNIVTLIQRY